MPAALGDPPAVIAREARTTHGVLAAPSYAPARPVEATAVGRAGARPDGRASSQLRPVELRVGAVPNAAGSAFYQQGKTKLIAGVYGPRQLVGLHSHGLAEGVLNVEIQFANFASRQGADGEFEKRALLYSSVLQRALESVVLLGRYPKAAIDITILVLEDDGAVLSASLAAASLALADAAIEMKDLIVGATVHLVGGSGPSAKPALLLDCCADEERNLPDSSAVVHLGFCCSRKLMCMMHSVGPLPGGPFEEMVLLAKDTAEAVGAEIRECLEKRVTKRAIKRIKREGVEAREEAAEEADDVEDDDVEGLLAEIDEAEQLLEGIGSH